LPLRDLEEDLLPSCDAVITHPDAEEAARAGGFPPENDAMSGPEDLKRIAGAFDRYSATWPFALPSDGR